MAQVNFNLLNSLFGSVGFLKAVLIGIVVVCLILLYIKYKDLRRVYLVVIIVAIFFTGIYGFYYNFTYMNATGQNIGTIINSAFSVTEVEENEDTNFWIFKTLAFESTGNLNEYQSRVSLNKSSVIDLGTKDYDIYLNDKNCFNSENSSEYVKSTFTYDFYLNDSEFINDTLYIEFYSYNNSNLLILTTKGGTDAVKLWSKCQEKQGIKIELKDKINVDLTSDLPVVDYDVKLNEFINDIKDCVFVSGNSNVTNNYTVLRVSIDDNCYSNSRIDKLKFRSISYPRSNDAVVYRYFNINYNSLTGLFYLDYYGSQHLQYEFYKINGVCFLNKTAGIDGVSFFWDNCENLNLFIFDIMKGSWETRFVDSANFSFEFVTYTSMGLFELIFNDVDYYFDLSSFYCNSDGEVMINLFRLSNSNEPIPFYRFSYDTQSNKFTVSEKEHSRSLEVFKITEE